MSRRHNLLLLISNEKTFLRDFLVILKRVLQNYQKILKKCFLGTGTSTTWTVMFIKTSTTYWCVIRRESASTNHLNFVKKAIFIICEFYRLRYPVLLDLLETGHCDDVHMSFVPEILSPTREAETIFLDFLEMMRHLQRISATLPGYYMHGDILSRVQILNHMLIFLGGPLL